MNQTTTNTGAEVVARGSGFQQGLTFSVGNQLAAVTRTDSSTLTFIVPAIDPGVHDAAITNPAGTTYVVESGIIVGS